MNEEEHGSKLERRSCQDANADMAHQELKASPEDGDVRRGSKWSTECRWTD